MPQPEKTFYLKMMFKAEKRSPLITLCRQGWRKAMDFLLPPLCLCCDGPVTETQTLCAACWMGIHFIDRPFCARCGAPFDLPVEAGTLCAACLTEEPCFTVARSAVLYDEASKPLILKLKHADRLHPVPAMAAWMARAGQEIWPQVDVIVPVPLHRWRLLKRRYNQSALLAQALGKIVGKPVFVDGLLRVRATETQGHLCRAGRQKNVSGAFAVRKKEDFARKGVVLIDDVLTSGATVQECARSLREAGVERVFVVTFARVHEGD